MNWTKGLKFQKQTLSGPYDTNNIYQKWSNEINTFWEPITNGGNSKNE